jgi:hypothetical protein
MKWPKPRSVILAASLVLNVVFAGWLLLDRFNSPSGRLGRLEKDITAGSIVDRQRIPFRLPKGLTVRDESPRGVAGIGMFEPYRFAVVITTDDSGAVNYSIPEGELHDFGEIYSMDLKGGKKYFPRAPGG